MGSDDWILGPQTSSGKLQMIISLMNEEDEDGNKILLLTKEQIMRLLDENICD